MELLAERYQRNRRSQKPAEGNTNSQQSALCGGHCRLWPVSPKLCCRRRRRWLDGVVSRPEPADFGECPVPLWAVQAMGSCVLWRRLPPEGRRALASSTPLPVQLPDQKSRQKHLGRLGLAGLREEGCLEGRRFCRDICGYHTPIPGASSAAAFKQIVQRRGNGRGAWVATEPWAHRWELEEQHCPPPSAPASLQRRFWLRTALEPRMVGWGESRPVQGRPWLLRESRASCTAGI